MDLFIISGLSGSGKSIALQALEDLDYYCIDNLPSGLLTPFIQMLASQGPGDARTAPDKSVKPLARAAISIDSRNRWFLEALPKTLEELTSLGFEHRTIFLEADEATLVKRYSETRRKHPLTDSDTSLVEGIRLERTLLQPIADSASKIINTSATTPHELRGLVRDLAGGGGSADLTVLVESFGFKYGTPRDADFVFDIRCLPNPHWIPDLKPLTGLDAPVIGYLESQSSVVDMIDDIRDFIQRWLPHFIHENRSYITIAIGCTGGQHRSVFAAERLAKALSDESAQIQVRHRELTAVHK